MTKYELLEWLKNKRVQHLFAATNPHIDEEQAGWHRGWADALAETRLQIMALPEDEERNTA